MSGDTEATKAARLFADLDDAIQAMVALGFPYVADTLQAAAFRIKRDAEHIASLEKALDYLRGENRRLTERAGGLASYLNAANEAFDNATAELVEWRTKYEELYAELKQRGVDKRSYHTRSMKAENALREIHAQAGVARDLEDFVAFVLHHVECVDGDL